MGRGRYHVQINSVTEGSDKNGPKVGMTKTEELWGEMEGNEAGGESRLIHQHPDFIFHAVESQLKASSRIVTFVSGGRTAGGQMGQVSTLG